MGIFSAEVSDLQFARTTSHESGAHRRRTKTTTYLLLVTLMLLGGCEKLWLDKQMKELCAKDGGVKVYETVTLPPEMFDQHGDPFPGWRARKEEERFGSAYRYANTYHVINPGEPSKGEGRLLKVETTITRVEDGKLLGVSMVYGRSGGDFMLWMGHPSHASCPQGLTERDLIRSVFVKGGGSSVEH